jgi:hypothetical protein
MRAGWVNSGHASKFSQAGRIGGVRKHIFVSRAGPISSHQNRRPHAHGPSTVELSFRARVLVAVKIEEEATMGRGLLLWLIGIPIPIILLIWLFGGLHG